MGYSVSKKGENDYGKFFGTESAFREEEILWKGFFVDFADDIL